MAGANSQAFAALTIMKSRPSVVGQQPNALDHAVVGHQVEDHQR
jgi:hypothetical protein